MNLLEKIDFLRNENNLNKRQLSLKCGLPYTTIDGWYKVGFGNMKLGTFKTLCTFFGVTMDSMAYDDKDIEYISDVNRAPLTAAERQLLNDFSLLDDRGRSTVLDIAARERSYTDNKEDKDFSEANSVA